MAGRNEDRTEKPTPKRKREARRKGQVARSPDVSGWLVLLAASLVAPTIFGSAEKRLFNLMGAVANVVGQPTTAGVTRVFDQGLSDVTTIVLPVLGGFAVLGLAANFAQTGLVLTTENLTPKWERINPLKGIKRMASGRTLWELGKQTAKLALLVVVCYGILAGMVRSLITTQPVGLGPILSYTGSKVLLLLRAGAGLGLLIGLADYAFQRKTLQKSLKMTRHEVKEEHRQSEGDPLLRREVRRKMFRLSRSRMMAAVAHADVVVVNPTHFAVALRYEPGRGRAPRVVAKGADELATRIREEARKHSVPVIQDAPVARAIYAACDADEQIPADLYVAVARLLAFVFTLPAPVRASGTVHRRRTSAMVA
jgi:flagellar biosynthetic protein FlhB